MHFAEVHLLDVSLSQRAIFSITVGCIATSQNPLHAFIAAVQRVHGALRL